MGRYFLRSASRANSEPAMSSSPSYGMVHRESKTLVMVNAGLNDRVDEILDWIPGKHPDSPSRVKATCFYEGINTLLFDDDPPYKVFRLIFTSSDGSHVTYLAYSSCGQVMDYVMGEAQDNKFIWFAKYLLFYERVQNDIVRAIEDIMNKRRLVKRDLEENRGLCVICQEEYRALNIIWVLPCKHSYHERCIKKWLSRNKKNKKKRRCPTCRANVFRFKG